MSKHLSVISLAFLLLLQCGTAVGSQFPLECDASGSCRLILSWPDASKEGRIRLPRDAAVGKDFRITSRTAITIVVRDFNFLQYELQFNVEKKKVESYGFLEALWSQILGLGSKAAAKATGAGDDAFYIKMFDWRRALKEYDELTTEAIQQVTAVGLSAVDRGKVESLVKLSGDRLSAINENQRAAEDELRKGASLDKVQFFESTVEMHQKVEARLRSVVKAGGLSLNGFEKSFPPLPSGYIVTISATPTSRDGSTAKAVVVEFFVNSELPLTYHVGLSYNRLPDVKFEKVRTVAGADLFSQVTDEKESADLVAFMSYQLGRVRTVPLFATLGTDVTSPGKRLYVGATAAFGRLYLTAGFISAKVKEGEDSVVDRIIDASGNTLGARELFSTVRKRREWRAAFAITFRPF